VQRLISLLIVVALPQIAFAETYVGGFFGVSQPNDFSNARGTDRFSSVTITDLAMANSYSYGEKVGYYFQQTPWMGLEAEVFRSNPHIKQQSVATSGLGIGTTGSISGGYVRVITGALNILTRYPGKRFQPYAGLGRIGGCKYEDAGPKRPGLGYISRS
jgi:hypothetical protein